MEKGKNIVFVVIVALVLCSSIAYSLVALLPGVDTPRGSSLEGRSYTTARQVAGKSFVEGAGQDAFEQFVADRVPMRDNVILFSSALQRQGIRTAAAAMGYTLYPTFFDSEYAMDDERNFLYKEAQPAPSKAASLDAFVETLNKSAKKHEKVRYVVVAALRPQQMEVNPTHDLMTSFDAIDSAWFQEHYIDRLRKSITARVDTCDSIDELVDGWYRTDVHWTLRRAFESYNWIAEQLDLEQVEWDDSKEVVVSPSWVGSSARVGRDYDVTSQLVDQDDDFSMLSYYTLKKGGKGNPYTPGVRERFLAGELDPDDESLKVETYECYYGKAQAMYIENEGVNNGKTCLIVADSFGYCLHRYIARNYEHTVVLFPGNVEVKRKFDWYVNHCDVDDVIVLTHGKKYANFITYSPTFVGWKG